MSYASLDPRMWDDDKVVALDANVPLSPRLLWVYLLTGNESLSGPPGLVVIGVAGLAEAMRCSTQEVATALDRMRTAGMIEIDPLHRLIRIPKAPFYRAPGNPNVVRGWYRRWTSLPNSQLKYDHLESMREALAMADVGASSREMFDQTFGRDLARRVAFRSGEVKSSPVQLLHQGGAEISTTPQCSLPLGALVAVADDLDSDADPVDSAESSGITHSSSGSGAQPGTIREPFRNGSRMADTEIRNVYVDVDQDPDPDPSRDPTECVLAPVPPEPYALPVPPPEPDPVPRMALALRTWRLERVLALQAAGIGASLPPPSIHDEVAKGEPDRLVRSWYSTAILRGEADPEEVVRRRSTQLLDALEASARRAHSIAGLRETVCYSAKVVDWALTTEAASAGRPHATSRASSAARPALGEPIGAPLVMSPDERAAALAWAAQERSKLDTYGGGTLAAPATQGASV